MATQKKSASRTLDIGPEEKIFIYVLETVGPQTRTFRLIIKLEPSGQEFTNSVWKDQNELPVDTIMLVLRLSKRREISSKLPEIMTALESIRDELATDLQITQVPEP